MDNQSDEVLVWNSSMEEENCTSKIVSLKPTVMAICAICLRRHNSQMSSICLRCKSGWRAGLGKLSG